MTFRRKVILISMAVLGLLSLGAGLVDPPGGPPQSYSGLGYMYIMMCGVAFEVFVLLLIGLVLFIQRTKDKELVLAGKEPIYKQRAKAFFLAAGLILLVGVSLCFGGAAVVYG